MVCPEKISYVVFEDSGEPFVLYPANNPTGKSQGFRVILFAYDPYDHLAPYTSLRIPLSSLKRIGPTRKGSSSFKNGY
jgi:hypothetical protein